MKFAHIADCHLGGWREPKMRAANEESFVQTINKCIQEKVEFVLISGDLFNTAFPAIDSMRIAVEKIKELKDKQIPVYIIPGSHDSSASGKTIIDVIESAGLAINVAWGTIENEKLKLNFTTDTKTGVKIAGLLGKRGGLEKEYYQQLSNEHLENEDGYKIFMFHSSIQELKPKEFAQMDAMSASLLPKNFNYYAGGHVHIVHKADIEERKNIVYPGPTFPNNFSEIEKLQCGSFCIIDTGDTSSTGDIGGTGKDASKDASKIRHEKVQIHPTISLTFECENKTVQEINLEMQKKIEEINAQNAIITIRLFGKMREGKTSELEFKKINSFLEEKGAYFVMKNTNSLTSPEFEEIKVAQGTQEEIEQKIISEHAQQITLKDYEQDKLIIKQLLQELCTEKNEAEKIADFEKRLADALNGLMLANLIFF